MSVKNNTGKHIKTYVEKTARCYIKATKTKFIFELIFEAMLNYRNVL